MSTRSMIVRIVKGEQKDRMAFKGVYHHWDGYPSWLGAELYHAIKNDFHGDLSAFLKYAIDDHPAGWSSFIVRCPDTQIKQHDKTVTAFGPDDQHCFCHGWRSEEACAVDGTEDNGMEYGYAFDEASGEMLILDRVYHSGEFQGKHAIGAFGCGPSDDKAGWKVIHRFNLATDPAPNWDKLG